MININIENEYSGLKTVILGIASDLGDPPTVSDAYDPRSLYHIKNNSYPCLLYTSPSPRDRQKSRMPSPA